MNIDFISHFQSEVISTVIDGVSSDILVPEMVSADQPIVSLSGDITNGSFQLTPGKHSVLSVDGSQLLAERSGYPIVNKINEDSTVLLSVDIVPLVTVSEDGMVATLDLYPTINGNSPLLVSEILSLCKELHVCHGVDSTLIQETIDRVEKLKRPLKEVPVARGLLPIHGKDAFLRFEVEIGPLPGKILQDGSIDWRERKIFIGIDQNELIATKVDPTEGTPGVDVFGNTIPQKPGKDIKVKVTGDVEYIEERRQVIATNSGVLSVVNETDIKVSAKQTIDGDVDFSVGNVESNSGLEIKKDVKPGFKVNCRGDVLVGGNINNSNVTTKGNIKVVGGLIGENSRLTTSGDVEIAFVERGTVSSKGTVMISKGCYYGTIMSDHKIMCVNGAKLVGGIYCCGGDFIAGNIGSDNAAPLYIACGVEPYRLMQLKRQRRKVKELEHELETLVNMHGKNYRETRQFKQQETSLQKMKNNIKKFNLIKGTPLYSGLDPNYDHIETTITVQGKISSGTQIRIGNTQTTVSEDAVSICFQRDRSSGHIIALPYTEGCKNAR